MAFDHGPHRAMITEVLDAIARGGKPSNDATTGLPVQRLIEAWLRSAQTGRAEAP
jgi:predicted dehydrogenase